MASNLPDGDAASGEQESQSAETRERVNYDFSATQRQVERGPGAIERVTVAVLVDGLRGEETGTDEPWLPRPDPELEVLRDLVASAVGYREDRGDMVTVRTMQFGDLPAVETAPGLTLPWLTGGQIVQIVTALLLAVVALVAILVGLKSLRGRTSADVPPLLPEAPQLAGPAAGEQSAALAPPQEEASEDDDMSFNAGLPDTMPDMNGLPDLSDLSALSMQNGMDDAAASDDPIERLRQLISDRRDETIEVLRGWVDDTTEDAQ